VDIFWNWDDNFKVKEVEAVFFPRDVGIEESRGFWYRVNVYMNKWNFDIGNSSEAWLQAPALTPEGVFGALLREGFSNETELQRALKEFAHIEECEWARNILAGFNA
jgi:hypothetical protein